MHKAFKMLLAVIMAVGLLSAVPATANAAYGDTTCHVRMRWDQDHMNDGTLGADEYWFKVRHYYLYCVVEGQPDFVVLKKSIYSYNFEGNREGCGFLVPNALQRIWWNSYFWDAVGRNANPAKVDLGCSETSEASKTVFYHNAPRLYTVHAVPPRFKTTWETVRTGPFSNIHEFGTLSGHLRKCSGRGSTPC